MQVILSQACILLSVNAIQHSIWIDFFAVAIAVNMAGKISRPVKSHFSEGFLGARRLLFLI
jgi:hypothetical protein